MSSIFQNRVNKRYFFRGFLLSNILLLTLLIAASFDLFGGSDPKGFIVVLTMLVFINSMFVIQLKHFSFDKLNIHYCAHIGSMQKYTFEDIESWNVKSKIKNSYKSGNPPFEESCHVSFKDGQKLCVNCKVIQSYDEFIQMLEDRASLQREK
jgi:hypothetical protein